MSKPARLTLNQALGVIKKPLERGGDLVIVQVMKQPAGWGPPNGENRSTLMPGAPKDGKFNPIFPPETGPWLQQWYKAGGWVESLVHFTGQELALFFEYQGGTFKPGAYAGSVGDPSAFENDCKEAATYEPVLTSEVVRTFKGAILRQHKKYLVPAQTGEKFLSGRKPGTKSVITKYLTELISRFPDLSSKELYVKALDEIRKGNNSPFTNDSNNELIKPDGKPLVLKTFENTVSKLKKARS